MEEEPTHIMAVVAVVAIGIFVPAYYAMDSMAGGATDKRLAEQASKVATVAESLNGPGSGATLDVQVPEGTTMIIRPGVVSYDGKNTNDTMSVPVNCSLTLTGGSYDVKLEYTVDSGITCRKW